MLVYLNGQYVDASTAQISADDRGFLFADGVYEVIRVYDGRPFLMEPHMQRMSSGLRALRIRADAADGLPAVVDKLLDSNQLRQGDATIYIQVTRGAAPRRHSFPEGDVAATVYVTAKPFKQHPHTYFTEGVAAVTVPDTRWTRCDIKSISLLPNVLANQQAREAGAFEALFIKDGIVIEGSHSNLFGVIDGQLMTYPACNYILAGITRTLILNVANDLGVPTVETGILQDQLPHVEELFLSGTTTEVMPVVRVDGRVVGSGRPGTVTQRLAKAFRASRKG